MESGNALIAEAAGYEEKFAVCSEADSAAYTAVICCGRLHQSRIGIADLIASVPGRDCGDYLYTNILSSRMFVLTVMQGFRFSALICTRISARVTALISAIISILFFVFIDKDCIGHFCQHIEHSRVSIVKSEMSWAGTGRKMNIARGIGKPAGLTVELIDIDCIQSEVTYKDLPSQNLRRCTDGNHT